ncbi:hypothetical protein [Hyphomicrobium methylovorum]|uniref:hypothetical protein n=1 Tax=Hyphomicrobium methylovorum TaxID=84 RepID=UPI0015E7E3A0|nr:hypothetical protein [Hyphomicrobium methylovorum]
MKFVAASALLIAAQALSANAHSADFLKAEVKPVEIRAGGELTGCGLEYSGVFLDHIYRSGELSGVSGTINIMKVGKGGVGLFFKMGLVDWTDPELNKGALAKIDKAYVRSGNEFAPDKSVPCDNPNGFCGGSDGDATMKFFTSAMQNKIQIGLNRVPKGMDILLTLPEPPPPDDVKFLECTIELLDALVSTGR